jgi:hypothetical protein
MTKLFQALALILLGALMAPAQQTTLREKGGPRAKLRAVRTERAMAEIVSGQLREDLPLTYWDN